MEVHRRRFRFSDELPASSATRSEGEICVARALIHCVVQRIAGISPTFMASKEGENGPGLFYFVERDRNE